MVDLSKRLAQVADFIPPGSVVADIGADHGFLAIYLIETGRASRVIAGEINPGPYQTALLAVQSSGLEKSIDLRFGDGLKVLEPGEVDVVVLAGMGGHTVCSILNANGLVLTELKRLIIQPMRDVALVRQWLLDHGWRLVDEELIREDGHYYVIIVAEPGREIIADKFFLEVGPRLLEKHDRLLYDYLIKRWWDLTVVLHQLQNSEGVKGRERAAAVYKEIEKIKEVLKHW